MQNVEYEVNWPNINKALFAIRPKMVEYLLIKIAKKLRMLQYFQIYFQEHNEICCILNEGPNLFFSESLSVYFA